MAQQDYLVTSWQALLQMIVNLCGKGYYHYHLTELPVSKQSKWGEIDKKIIKKYKTNKSKWQRHRIKAKGVANFYYLRWQNIMVILHTQGSVSDEIVYDDRFSDIRQSPIYLKISEMSAFRIQLTREHKVRVYLTKDTYRGLKDILYNASKTGNIYRMAQTFNIINGFPAYSGIIEQKKRLANYLISQAKRNNVHLSWRNLRFNTKKNTVPNFYR
ncbi:hypothetical protein JOC77_002969 [Peribacillus deserti]|uniref:Transposase n=1 Tax=Peribacillus deserti TaxID=673318 RepID=A0ABS2QLD4_9BACI|nr:hypothetical protein [Peribacillus deserti]MBM7693529.1 hypothetical protein [Peribacillus deserti]